MNTISHYYPLICKTTSDHKKKKMSHISICCNSLVTPPPPSSSIQPITLKRAINRRQNTLTASASKSGGFSFNSIFKAGCKTCEGGGGGIQCPGCKGTGKNKKDGNMFERWNGCFTVMGHSRVERIRAVASEGSSATLKTVEEKVKLGGSDLKVSTIGIGAWSWGDTTYWNNFQWNDRNEKAARNAFNASIDGGLTFIDTAEVYGSGLAFGAINSETLLGRYIRERKEKEPDVEVEVATKFAALPWRLGRQSVLNALKDSLCRLGLTSVDLYQLHWPGVWGNEGYIDGLGDAVEKGLVKAVGVSNYNEKRVREAYEKLKKRGIPLASNQVNYSLIYRAPEENGVKAACDELGITLIAYSPIAQGILTGKYTPDKPPSGPRGRIYTPEFLTKLQPLLNKISEIGGKYNKTCTQVSLNWLVAQGNVVPIPGAKTAEQAEEFIGALGWRLTDEEVAELRNLASKVKSVIGFPVEKL